MPTRTGAKKLRERILRERGINPVSTKRSRRFRMLPPTPLDSLKTTHMRLLEGRHGKPIEELLMRGSSREVGKQLGINYSTVTKWIERLDLRYRPDRLPSCYNCIEKDVECQTTGWCHILSRIKADEPTVSAKRKEVLDALAVRRAAAAKPAIAG